jgi:hypothetical protein
MPDLRTPASAGIRERIARVRGKSEHAVFTMDNASSPGLMASVHGAHCCRHRAAASSSPQRTTNFAFATTRHSEARRDSRRARNPRRGAGKHEAEGMVQPEDAYRRQRRNGAPLHCPRKFPLAPALDDACRFAPFAGCAFKMNLGARRLVRGEPPLLQPRIFLVH